MPRATLTWPSCRASRRRARESSTFWRISARHGFCDVDLVFLDTDDIVTRYEAVRLNELVYAAADFDRGALYSSIVRQYLDFLPYLNVQRLAYKRSILGGQD